MRAWVITKRPGYFSPRLASQNSPAIVDQRGAGVATVNDLIAVAGLLASRNSRHQALLGYSELTCR